MQWRGAFEVSALCDISSAGVGDGAVLSRSVQRARHQRGIKVGHRSQGLVSYPLPSLTASFLRRASLSLTAFVASGLTTGAAGLAVSPTTPGRP